MKFILAILLMMGVSGYADGTNATTNVVRRFPLTSANLEQIARRYVAEKKIEFSFEGRDKVIHAETNGLRWFTRVTFLSTDRGRFLEVDIDPRGNVLSNSVGKAVCGLGRFERTNASSLIAAGFIKVVTSRGLLP